MELFEQLRREYEFGIGTIKGIARKFGVHRRLVRQAVNSAIPPVRTYRQRPRPVLGAVEGFIDGILEADRQAPRKQRHTARRIYRRILAEMPGHAVAESTVRNYVRDRKRSLGLLIQETYVAQSYQWGGEAQVDWYEAYAVLAGDLTKLQVFCMRSMASVNRRQDGVHPHSRCSGIGLEHHHFRRLREPGDAADRTWHDRTWFA
ncbi:hypothetical protein SAE02_75420 [Skermanella aerolata]|uniref:HTH IS21-type domain-containing protein n=1 Tax=Skermanella aerolata TaxID=393310 RepID=A0A512E3U2_9PROT|nr:hypothetical protein SAE02_75420 [Skermanella aerolata]